MALDPSYPLYAQDYLVKSLRWSDAMKALYNDLRAEMWINGPLQDDNGAPFGLTEAQRATFFLIKKEFFLCREGWINSELQEAREKRASFRHRQSNNGKKGGRPAGEKKSEETGNENPEESQLKPVGFENDNPNETQLKPKTNPEESLLEKENEKENGKGSVTEGVQGEGQPPEPVYIVPEMLSTWKKHKPRYIFRRGVDEAPLRIVAEMISKQIGADMFTPEGVAAIVPEWDAVVQFILTDTLYKDFQLTQVEKYFQAITAKMESKLSEQPPPLADKNTGKTSVIKNNISAASGAHELIKNKYKKKNESDG